MVREDTSIQQWVRVTGCLKDDWDGKFWLSNKMWPTVRDINNITRRNWSNWNGETLTVAKGTIKKRNRGR